MSRDWHDRAAGLVALALLAAGFIAWAAVPVRGASATPSSSLVALWLAAGIVAAAGWIAVRVPSAARSSLPAAVLIAAIAPLVMVPLERRPGHAGPTLALLVATLAVIPLAAVLVRRPDPGIGRIRVVFGVVGLLGAATAIALATPAAALRPSAIGGEWATLRWGLVTVALIAAAVPAIRAGARRGPIADPVPAVVLDALVIAGAVTLPIVTGLALAIREWFALVLPAIAAAATVAILARLAIGPLARGTGMALTQRDLVVRATDAERRRLAEAIHDGPLAGIALLVQRLDADGLAEHAALARSVADELRSVGAELRSPLLDDLGVAPALEWLVDRLGRGSGFDIELHSEATVRPDADVEAAFYRIAQEAIVNAIRHAAGPIGVRYTSARDAVTLVVDDAGPGIDADAARAARDAGRLGLTLMAQRARAIGASFRVARRPDGGTRVEVRWAAGGLT